MSGSIWNCPNKRGAYCTAPVWCETFNGADYASYDYTYYNFKFEFTSNPDFYSRIPLQALMRNGPADGNPQCNLLVFQTKPSSRYSSQIIIGEAILMQYFVEFSMNGNGNATNNTMTLTQTPYTLSNAVFSNVQYSNSTPDTPVDPQPDPSDVIPAEPEPSTPRFSTLQKVEIYGAGAIGIMLVFLVILMIYAGCKSKSSPGGVYGDGP